MADKRIHELPLETNPTTSDFLVLGNSLISMQTSKVTINVFNNKYSSFVTNQRNKYIKNNDTGKPKYSNMVHIHDFDEVYYYYYNDYLPPGSSGFVADSFSIPTIKNKTYIISYDFTINMKNSDGSSKYILYYKNKLYRTGVNSTSVNMNYVKTMATLHNSYTTAYPYKNYDVLKPKLTNTTSGPRWGLVKACSILNYSSSDISGNLPRLLINLYNQRTNDDNNCLLFSIDFNKESGNTTFDYVINGKIKIEVI